MLVTPSQSDTEQSFLNAALSYARLGFHVFPIKPKCKAPPLVKKWQEQATTDMQTIRMWWTRWPNANIGIATGRKSGFFVLDIDSKNTGFVSLSNLILEHGNLPETGKQKTGSGEHYLFRSSFSVRNSAGKIGSGIDIRGDGGYIVAAPSIHPNGARYEWFVEPTGLANAPDWLLRHIQQSKSTTSTIKQIDEGHRNDTLFRKGCALRQKGLKAKALGAELIRINQNECRPPLPDSEVGQIIDSVLKQSNNAKKPLFTFRDFVCKESPKIPTLRHILHTISFFMDVDGKPAYPTMLQIAEMTGYSEPTVIKWIKFAVDEGLIIRKKHKPAGQKWFNYFYVLPSRFYSPP